MEATHSRACMASRRGGREVVWVLVEVLRLVLVRV